MNFIKIMDQDICLIEKDLCFDQVKKEFADLFQGLGQIGGEYNIELNENINPVIQPPRRIPFKLKE